MVDDVLYIICYFKKNKDYFNRYCVKCALQISRIHIHQLFTIPTKDNLTPYRRAELAILNLMKKHKKIDFLCSVDMLAFDEMDQSSA